MKLVIQRVLEASVQVQEEVIAKIGPGLLVLVGISHHDQESDRKYLVQKLLKLRIFSDSDGKMNRSLMDTGGELLLVSQFTLFADTRKGNRPSFLASARPEMAEPFFNLFVQECQNEFGKRVQTGRFGAEMQVSLFNDGPVTILMDSNS